MGRPTKAQSAQIAERRVKAIEMRARQRPWSEIAEVCGYRDAAAASNDFRRALEQRREAVGLAVDDLREQELARLDQLETEAWKVLERQHVVVSGGKIVVSDDEPLKDDGPVLQAIDRLLRIAERRAKLLGIDSPVKIDTRGVVTFTIEGIDPEKLR